MRDEREVEVACRGCSRRRSGQRRLEQLEDAGGGDPLEEAGAGRAGGDESRQPPPG
jgi:hypothetical protein